MKKNILFISFLIFGIYAFAQEKLAHFPNKNSDQKVYHFTKALMINSSVGFLSPNLLLNWACSGNVSNAQSF